MVVELSQILPGGATVLDIGWGINVAISEALIERGFTVYGVGPRPQSLQHFELASQPSWVSVRLRNREPSS